MEFLPYSAVALAVFVATASAFNLHLAELDAVDDFDGVPVSTKLTPENFEQQLNSTKFYLVLFYAPWSVSVCCVKIFKKKLRCLHSAGASTASDGCPSGPT